MKHSCTLSQQSEISSAVASMEQAVGDCPMICTLLCEELLSHLVDAGYRDIALSARRFPHRCIEIRAAGEPDMLAAASGGDETSRIETEIRQSLLDQHAEHIDSTRTRTPIRRASRSHPSSGWSDCIRSDSCCPCSSRR